MAFQNDPISFVLNLHFNFFGNGRVMSDIKMCVLLGFFGTVLPDMRAKNSSGCRIDNVSAGMECSQGVSSLYIDFSMHLSPNDTLIDSLIEIMKKAFANFFNILDLICLPSKADRSKIINLSSRSRIECTLIK